LEPIGNDGLSDKVIKGIVILPDGFLLCGTEKEGIFMADLNLTTIDDINDRSMTFSLQQNYPNPFNPRTKIKYSVPYSDIVQIKIYDILGREIKTLLAEFKPTGTYEIEFDATSVVGGLPSGIYFYSLQAGSYISTKKMVLMK
jgi:hypothetical protein